MKGKSWKDMALSLCQYLKCTICWGMKDFKKEVFVKVLIGKILSKRNSTYVYRIWKNLSFKNISDNLWTKSVQTMNGTDFSCIFLQVRWYKDSMLLEETDTIRMTSRSNRHTLILSSIKSGQDFGNYSCVAENTLGTFKWVKVVLLFAIFFIFFKHCPL